MPVLDERYVGSKMLVFSTIVDTNIVSLLLVTSVLNHVDIAYSSTLTVSLIDIMMILLDYQARVGLVYKNESLLVSLKFANGCIDRKRRGVVDL